MVDIYKERVKDNIKKGGCGMDARRVIGFGLCGIVAVVIVTLFVCGTVLAATPGNYTGGSNPLIPTGSVSFKAITATSYFGDKPDPEATQAKWDEYYKKALETIASTTDASKRKAMWAELSKTLLTQAENNPGTLSASSMQKIMGNLYKEYKNTYNLDGTNKIADLSAIAAKVVDAAKKLVDHGEFFKFSEEGQVSFTQQFAALATEITWRKENNSKNSGMYDEISDVFGKIMKSGSNAVKASAFAQLVNVYRKGSWDNNDKVKAIMDDAIKAAGGVTALAKEFLDAFDKATDATEKGRLSVAMADLLQFNKRFELGSDQVKSLISKLTGYLKDLSSDGGTTASDGVKNGLMNRIGSYLNSAISEGKLSESDNKGLFDQFMAFSESSLKSSNVSVRATAINVLTSLLNNAKKKENDSALSDIKGVMDRMTADQIKDFLSDAKALFDANENKDSVAWLSNAMVKLATYHLAAGTGKVTESQVETALTQIGAWTSVKGNLSDMRWLRTQQALYTNTSSLVKQIYQKDSALAKNSNIGDAIVKIFSSWKTLQDAKVKAAAKSEIKELVTFLNANGYDTLANKLLALL